VTRFQPQHPFDDDRLHEECGVFGIFGTDDAAAHAALGLHALQHRGQEAAGIVAFDGAQFHVHRSLGLVSDVFASEAVMDRLAGPAAIGHNRYATTGDTVRRNVQPIFVETDMGGLALAHNGNLTNAHMVRKDLVKHGAIFQSTSDTEIIVHLVALSDMNDMPGRLIDALKQVVGAYSLVALTENAMIGVRDPLGVRPLVLGQLDGAYVLTSETCALDIIGAKFVRDIEPGEMVIIDRDGIRSLQPFPVAKNRFCVFEYIYFARPDSRVDGKNAYEVRKKMGAELARESSVPADVIVPVPDSGVPAALGYAEEAAIPFALGIIRNHYVGRTFIQPTQNIRHLGVKLKHNANRGELEGKRVVLLDDSIVRGTTSTKIVAMVRDAGATEVHMRIASPPNTNSCFYGVDTPSRDELLASRMAVEDMADHIGVDSLAFLTVDGLYRAAGKEEGRNNDQPQYCDACLTGDYPIPLVDREGGHGARQFSLLDDPS
jgi:amidophosphoribosyltransferase